MNYETLLKNAPPHDSEEFIDYLRENNTVIFENPQWILIENVKYHKSERPWLTAFHKGVAFWYQDIDMLYYHNDWRDWNWLKKSADKQTVKRFHIHIYKDL